MARQNHNDHAANTLRSATRESRNAKNYAHMNNHSLQNTEEEPIRARFERSRTRRTHEVPFHRRPEPLYTEKHKVSCPGFPPKRSPCNIHAAITMRFATSGSKPASLDARRTWQDKTTTIMQPLHCDLQPESQETQGTTHTWTTTRCRTQRRNRFAPGSSAAAPAAHTRYLSSPARAT